MKPSWIELEEKTTEARKICVLAKIDKYDQVADLEREQDYQQLMEDTGRSL